MADGMPRFQVDEWLDDLAVDPQGHALMVKAFVEQYHLWQGDGFAGEPFKLLPFQHAIINRIYGPRTDDGNRLVREAAIWIPRGNAKTTLAAALANCHLYGPEAEAGGQVILAAADKPNAGIAYQTFYQLALEHEWPKDVLNLKSGRMEADYKPNNSTLRTIGSESYNKHGLSATFFLGDELHVWPETYARQLYNAIKNSMAKRPNTTPLIVTISVVPHGTGGFAVDRWNESLAVARGEKEQPTFAPIIFAADPDCDWRDERVWFDVNPALEHGLLSLEALQIKVRDAEHFPADQVDFKQHHLNIPPEGVAEPWIELDLYDAAKPRAPLEDLLGERCYLGIDLSRKGDLTAVVAVFPDGNGGYDVLAKFFLPADNIAKKAEEDRASYQQWADAGDLVLTEGNVVDLTVVEQYIYGLGADYDVRTVHIDFWGALSTIRALQEADFEVVEFRQGMKSYAVPTEELKHAILTKQFRHGGNPVLRMCFANAVPVKDENDNERLTKKKSRGRIDGAQASAMAIAAALADDAPDYDEDPPVHLLGWHGCRKQGVGLEHARR